MDFSRFAFICLACVALVRMTEAGCKEETEKKEDYQLCRTSYAGYLTNAGASMSTGDLGQISLLLCSKEGKAAMLCLEQFIAECPDIKTDPMLSAIGVLDQVGGCDNFPTHNQPGGMGGSECYTALSTCSQMGSSFEGDETAYEGSFSEYGKAQEQTKSICKQLGSMLTCLKKYEEQCPELEGQMKAQYSAGTASDSNVPSYDQQKDFALNQCPKLPEDFSTNKCVKPKLIGESFKTCYNNKTDGLVKNGMLTCDGFKASFPCVADALKDCGKDYVKGVLMVTNFHLSFMQENCKITSDGLTSSADAIKVSSAILLSLLMLVL